MYLFLFLYFIVHGAHCKFFFVNYQNFNAHQMNGEIKKKKTEFFFILHIFTTPPQTKFEQNNRIKSSLLCVTEMKSVCHFNGTFL